MSDNLDGSLEKPDSGQPPAIHITLTDPLTSRLKVEALIPNIDVGINMLQQTLRVLEAERRKMEAAEFQAEQQTRAMEWAVKSQLGRRPS